MARNDSLVFSFGFFSFLLVPFFLSISRGWISFISHGWVGGGAGGRRPANSWSSVIGCSAAVSCLHHETDSFVFFGSFL